MKRNNIRILNSSLTYIYFGLWNNVHSSSSSSSSCKSIILSIRSNLVIKDKFH